MDEVLHKLLDELKAKIANGFTIDEPTAHAGDTFVIDGRDFRIGFLVEEMGLVREQFARARQRDEAQGWGEDGWSRDTWHGRVVRS